MAICLALTIAAAGLAGCGDRSAQAPGAAARTIGWEALVPREWDPVARFRQRHAGRMAEGDVMELALMREMREVWDNAPTRHDLDGARVRLAGYVVPLDPSAGQVREFLLVPYFGACIHSPPPPANQIVQVVLAQPGALRSMQTVWVSGTMKVWRQSSAWGVSGYRLEAGQVEPYQPPPEAKPPG